MLIGMVIEPDRCYRRLLQIDFDFDSRQLEAGQFRDDTTCSAFDVDQVAGLGDSKRVTVEPFDDLDGPPVATPLSVRSERRRHASECTTHQYGPPSHWRRRKGKDP